MHWKIKAYTQFVLAHVPGGERINYQLQQISKSHTPEKYRGRITGLTSMIAKHLEVEGKVIVEIGTGWDAVVSILLFWMGAAAVYTYDHVRHVRFALVKMFLAEMPDLVGEVSRATSIPEAVLRERFDRLAAAQDLDTLFRAAGIRYYAPADATRTGLPDHSVDVVCSYAVLEHVPESVIDGITAEAKRILKPGGVAFHSIGLQDHFVSFDPSITTVNFLQCPEWWWRIFVKHKIQYLNRLRRNEYLKLFQAHGARVEVKEFTINPGDLAALKTMKVDRRFEGMALEELAVTKLVVGMTF